MMATPWTKIRYTWLQPRWWWAFLEQLRSLEQLQNVSAWWPLASFCRLSLAPCASTPEDLCPSCPLCSQARSSQGEHPDPCCAGGKPLSHLGSMPSRRLYCLIRVLHWSEHERETFHNNSTDFILLTSHLFKAVFSLGKKDT